MSIPLKCRRRRPVWECVFRVLWAPLGRWRRARGNIGGAVVTGVCWPYCLVGARGRSHAREGTSGVVAGGMRTSILIAAHRPESARTETEGAVRISGRRSSLTNSRSRSRAGGAVSRSRKIGLFSTSSRRRTSARRTLGPRGRLLRYVDEVRVSDEQRFSRLQGYIVSHYLSRTRLTLDAYRY